MNEKDSYKDIKICLEKLFTDRVGEAYLELTSDKSFSDTLKSQIPRGHEIIFNFLKNREARPDITGFIKTKHSTTQFIVVEVKKGPLKLDDIYQIKKYTDLLNAKFSFLVSLSAIPEELRRLGSVIPQVTHASHWSQVLALVYFDITQKQFVEWHPKNPFEEDFRWSDYSTGS
jgi:hypothetical protein